MNWPVSSAIRGRQRVPTGLARLPGAVHGGRSLLPALMASLLLVTGCTTPHWESATFDQFLINRGRVKNGDGLIRVVAMVPGGGALAEAVGSELAGRGFKVVPSATLLGMDTGVDFKAVSERARPGQGNTAGLWKLRHALHARGVDAFVIVRDQDFAPRPHMGRRFWQQADLEVYSTTGENATSNGAIAGTGFVNLLDGRASTAAEAAADMVTRIAMGPGAL